MRYLVKTAVKTIAILAWAGTSAQAESTQESHLNFFGTPGLLDMPSGMVFPDATLALSHARTPFSRRTTLSFQLSPRLLANLSYTGTDSTRGANGIVWDRSFDLHYNLLKEKKYTPSVAIGLRDFLGTGLLSSEYIVATKNVSDRLSFTAGAGWGRLGTSNIIAGSGSTRNTARSGKGGTANVDHWFTGPVGAFGGLSYKANDKITVLAEYSSDAYVDEASNGETNVRSPLNLGVKYQISDNVNATLAYMRGNELAFSLTGSLNPKNPAVNGGLETAPLPIGVRPSKSADALGWSGKWIEDGTDAPGIRKALSKAMETEGLVLEAMALSASRAEVKFRNTRYAAGAQALGRLARMMSRAYPPSVETFVLTETVNGIAVQSTVIQRSDLERLEFSPAGEILSAAEFHDPLAYASDPLVPLENDTPRLNWSIVPSLTLAVFDPDSPVRADVGLKGQATYVLRPGLEFHAAATALVSGSVGGNNTQSNPNVPVVRSDRADYADQFQLNKLNIKYFSRPAPNLYSRLSFGYLETMYAGASAEVLWKKGASPFALGAEVNYAHKRDADDFFALDDYNIVTGHVSGYMDFGNGYLGQVDAGRYLAGDWGATISLDREFNNGWRVGAYATLTDMPFEDFGEGSFDKGIRLTLPVDWFVGTPTKETRAIELQSLSRDGGARLNVDGRLYNRVRNAQQYELESRWGRFWR